MKKRPPVSRTVRRKHRRKLARVQKYCHICGGSLDMSTAFDSPDFPTLDHIVPLSRGGRSCLDNLHLAHRRCNAKKAAIDPFEQKKEYAELQKELGK